MKENMPIISVIIPTHNRSTSLRRMLDALNSQTYTLQQVEVIVVADGCTDGTAEMLRHYSAQFTLRFIEQSSQGPAVARNYGATFATGQLLLFLDDDIEPTKSLVEAHVCAHQNRSSQVVIGPYPPVFQSASFSHIELRAWWKLVFDAMLQPGHRFTCQDLLGGNFSLEKELFTRIGGFDPAFWAHEDYELGIRLIKAGVLFAVAANALGYHHDKSDFNRSFLRKRQEGRADVLMASLHPEILKTLPLIRFKMHSSLLNRTLRKLAFVCPASGDTLTTCLRYLLVLLESVRLRHYWRRFYKALQNYWYWRGVADELGTLRALADFVKDCNARIGAGGHTIELDLHEGLVAAEQRLDEERPVAACIRYGQIPVGVIHPQPGAEALRGAHLRPILANALAVPLLEALALEGKITTSTTVDRHRLSNAIGSLSGWFGPMESGKMWFEQYSQWNRLEREESQKECTTREYRNRFNRLVRETTWLEAQRANWQRLAEERERIIQEQQTLINELERSKASLEECRQWPRLAEENGGGNLT